MKPAPEQMLKLAQIVEPDTNWILLDSGAVLEKSYDNPYLYIFDPENKPAQLIQVVFAVAGKCKTIYQVSKLHDCLGAGNGKAIINLAIEVLL